MPPAFINTALATGRPETLSTLRALLSQTQGEGRAWHPSPDDWRDEILYFLLPDRFSDNRESSRPLLTRAEIRRLRQTSTSRPDIQWNQWADSGKRWQGGTINGVRGRLAYLQALGISAIWVGPVFTQRVRVDSYHGYGIQDFLDVDPRFGTRADLVALVRDAHARGMRIILDIIVNHTGDNWGYVAPGAAAASAFNEPPYRPFPDFYGNPHNPDTSGWRLAWRDEHQQGVTFDGASSTLGPHDAAFPRDFRDPAWYARAGRGGLGEGDIKNAHAEHKRTDFFALKDVALDAPGSLSGLTDCYKYWIALTDCDGFRIDTVKHMALEETRNFCGAIREFASTLGKDNFLLVGEIAGGDEFQDFVLDNLAILKRNLSSALDIGSQRLILAGVAKGLQPASDYFLEFDEASKGFESHRAFGSRHVSILDDHDHVFGSKLRFSTEIPDDSPVKDTQVVAATAIQLFTLGIPCIYYGTEQAFAGPARHQVQFLLGEGWNNPGNFGDRYLREAMFGPGHPRANHDRDLNTQVTTEDGTLPGFGAFGTVGQHCFDDASPAFIRIAALCRVRAAHPVLRDGRQYQRQMRLPHTGFELQPGGELVAWSRILDAHEALIVTNPNGGASRGGDVIVAAELSNRGDEFVVLVNTAEVAAVAAGGPGSYQGTHPAGSKVVVRGRNQPAEPAFVEIREVAQAEVIVLVKAS